MTHRKILAVVLWMSGALFCFSATAVAVRALAPTFTVFEILAMRNAAGVAILLATPPSSRRCGASSGRAAWGFTWPATAVHFAATYAWTLGITLLPLATVFALEFTAPAWVTLLAVLLLGEAATGGGSSPWRSGSSGSRHRASGSRRPASPQSLVVLGAALGFALTAIVTKVLTRTESVFAILTWMNVMQLVPNLIGSEPAFWLKARARRTSSPSGASASAASSPISA